MTTPFARASSRNWSIRDSLGIPAWEELINMQMHREWRPLRQWQLQMQPSTRLLDELSEFAALAEGRILRARRESGKTRGCRAPTFLWDRKVARRRNRVLAVGADVAWRARANHRAARTRSIRWDKLLHMPAGVRSFVGRSKRCI